ncbi:unnamed protein product [Trichogramma brassicae]|uniref:Uncharacterized protein n=1 Tax=Trichogramma brassicae TaxID=86971 RepID=A0A6H5I1B2_9HYME|nr:unnamed protein product [Trichogramma brassicae]
MSIFKLISTKKSIFSKNKDEAEKRELLRDKRLKIPKELTPSVSSGMTENVKIESSKKLKKTIKENVQASCSQETISHYKKQLLKNTRPILTIQAKPNILPNLSVRVEKMSQKSIESYIQNNKNTENAAHEKMLSTSRTVKRSLDESSSAGPSVYLGADITYDPTSWELTKSKRFKIFCREVAVIVWDDKVDNVAMKLNKAQIQLPGRSPRSLSRPRLLELFLNNQLGDSKPDYEDDSENGRFSCDSNPHQSSPSLPDQLELSKPDDEGDGDNGRSSRDSNPHQSSSSLPDQLELSKPDDEDDGDNGRSSPSLPDQLELSKPDDEDDGDNGRSSPSLPDQLELSKPDDEDDGDNGRSSPSLPDQLELSEPDDEDDGDNGRSSRDPDPDQSSPSCRDPLMLSEVEDDNDFGRGGSPCNPDPDQFSPSRRDPLILSEVEDSNDVGRGGSPPHPDLNQFSPSRRDPTMDSEVEDDDDDGSKSSSDSDSDKSSEESDDDRDEENENSSDSEPDQPLEVENINGIINDHVQEMDDLSEKNKWKILNGVTYRLCTQIKDLRNKWQVKLGLKKPKKKNRKSKKNKAKKTKTTIFSSKNKVRTSRASDKCTRAFLATRLPSNSPAVDSRTAEQPNSPAADRRTAPQQTSSTSLQPNSPAADSRTAEQPNSRQLASRTIPSNSVTATAAAWPEPRVNTNCTDACFCRHGLDALDRNPT